MRIDEISPDASNVEIQQLANPATIKVDLDREVSRYSYDWREGSLHALLVNKEADTLVVSFHGAVNRIETSLPRFERLKTLKEGDFNSLFFGDPTLYLDDKLSLSWFTGWQSVDIHRVIATWITQIVEQLNVRNLILSGSSGGGFAAMQIGAYIPNSIAVAFNAQTAIPAYKINGVGLGAQRDYFRCVRPAEWSAMAPASQTEVSVDWQGHFDERISVLERYKHPMDNYLIVVENDEEFHYEDHYLPLVEVLRRHQEVGRFRTAIYQGGKVHNPPTLPIFQKYIEEAIEWARGLPPAARHTVEAQTDPSWFDLMNQRFAGNDISYDRRLEDKIKFAELCEANGITYPRIIKTFKLSSSQILLPQSKSFVIKPRKPISGVSALIIERTSDGLHDICSGKTFTEKLLIDYIREWSTNYDQGEPSIVTEERIYDRGQYPIPRLFRFYAFNGNIELIQCIDRNRDPIGVTWFDGSFEPVSDEVVKVDSPLVTRVGFVKPPGADEMLILAGRISRMSDSKFAGVNFYLSPSGPVCGGLSFRPEGPFNQGTGEFSYMLQQRLGTAWVGQLNPKPSGTVTGWTDLDGGRRRVLTKPSITSIH